MKKSQELAAVAAAILALAMPAAAHAGSTGSGSYRLTARVPVSCWVRPDQSISSAIGQGSVVEACNSPGGFQVTAGYRPLAGGEYAKLNYDGRSIELGASGHAVLRRSHMAQIRTVDYRFEETSLENPLVLVLTIQPY